MSIIGARDMKIIDERKTQKKEKKNTQKQKKKQGVTEALVKGWELNNCCAFKLGFLQLILKASLIFKSNLELPLSIIF